MLEKAKDGHSLLMFKKAKDAQCAPLHLYIWMLFIPTIPTTLLGNFQILLPIDSLIRVLRNLFLIAKDIFLNFGFVCHVGHGRFEFRNVGLPLRVADHFIVIVIVLRSILFHDLGLRLQGVLPRVPGKADDRGSYEKNLPEYLRKALLFMNHAADLAPVRTLVTNADTHVRLLLWSL
jgi:hypothetical protein